MSPIWAGIPAPLGPMMEVKSAKGPMTRLPLYDLKFSSSRRSRRPIIARGRLGLWAGKCDLALVRRGTFKPHNFIWSVYNKSCTALHRLYYAPYYVLFGIGLGEWAWVCMYRPKPSDHTQSQLIQRLQLSNPQVGKPQMPSLPLLIL